MTDDNNDGNERAIKKVVKKHVSDVFGEEEKPAEPSYPTRGYDYGRSPDYWKRDNPGFAFQHKTEAERKTLTAASWGKPRATAMKDEEIDPTIGYDSSGQPTVANYTAKTWTEIRKDLFRLILKELDWERIVLMPDDHARLEQMLDTVMRRSKYQAGKEGDSYHYGSLVQVPITVGNAPAPAPEPLPASSMDLEDAWGKPDEDEVIDVNNPGDDNDNQ